MAISMVNEADERNHMRDILKLIKRDVPLITDHPWHLDMPAVVVDMKPVKPAQHEGKASHGNNPSGSSRVGNRNKSRRRGPRRDGQGAQSPGNHRRKKSKFSGSSSQPEGN
jgi:ATP-dependent RNA helicase RhlE